MINPGSIAGQIPLDPGDAMIRKIQDLERYNRELLPSLMAIFGPQIAALTAAQDTLTTTVSGLSTAQATLTTQQATLTALLGTEVKVDFGMWNATGTTTLPSTSMVDVGSFSVVAPSWAAQFIAVGVGTCQVVQQTTAAGGFGTSATQSLMRLTVGGFARSAYGLTTDYSQVGVSPTTSTLTQVGTPVTIAKQTITGGATITATLAASRQGGTTGWAQGGNAMAVFLFTR